MRNVEIKARIKELHKLIEKAKVLAGENSQVIKQHDTFYNVRQGRLKLRKFEDGKAELIYYERPDLEGPKMSLYEKAAIPSTAVDELHNVLDRALGSKDVLDKVRQLYLVGQTRVHIDSVAGLGDFMEIEVVLKPEQSIEEGEQIAFSLMDELGISRDDLISGAYSDLMHS